MDSGLATQLLESIAVQRLVVLCGAGLSMAAPSNLPSSVDVAKACRSAYREMLGEDLDPALGDDIEAIARHFFKQTNFDSVFIPALVPWSRFRAEPNVGHEALADFLACKAIPAVVTTNIDALCEEAAARLNEPAFWATVEETDLPQTFLHGCLLKVHGCAVRSRASTVWCPEQLECPPLQGRNERFKAWLATHLLGKDLLVIGFWSDWAYLSDLLAKNLTGIGPRRVYVVSPGEADHLKAKARQLWTWATGPGVEFQHVPESGDTFLDDLRREWSSRFIVRLMDTALQEYETLFGSAKAKPPDLGSLPSRTLYALRRDLTGTPQTAPVRDHEPRVCDRLAAAIHRRLLARHIAPEPYRYRVGETALRVVSGRGELLSRVRARYRSEPPSLVDVDQVICAGAIEDGSSADIVRGGGAGSIVRPGSDAIWTTHAPLLPLLKDGQ